jgi:chorismate synthase
MQSPVASTSFSSPKMQRVSSSSSSSRGSYGASSVVRLKSRKANNNTSEKRGRRGQLHIANVGSTYGRFFRVTTFGESHGGGVGCVVDGVPPKLQISREDLQFELDRRRPGQSRITTPRNEEDACEILSGVGLDGVTLGTPIAVLVRNKDHKSQDYGEIAVAYRPSHADATYDMKYGVRAIAGGGRSSARETIGRVAAGAIAKKILKQIGNTEILAYVSQVKDVKTSEGGVDHENFTMEDVEKNIVRCPDDSVAEKMIEAIDEVRVKGDSCGGVVTCIVRNCPRGLGAPVFDKLEADLAKAMMSLPATKGFEIGSGFAGVLEKGSEHNDPFYMDAERGLRTTTNKSGGIQGGISNGEIIEMKIAFKPTSTITRPQNTVNRDGVETELKARGRHDPCVVPRAVPMVESMVALVLIDHLMMQYAQCDLLGRDDYSFVRDGNMATLYDARAREAAAAQASKAGMSAKKMQEEYEEN